MEAELNGTESTGAYSETLTQPTFADLVESEFKDPVLPDYKNINSVYADQDHILHFQPNPPISEKSTSPKRDCAEVKSETPSEAASQQTFEPPVVKTESGSQESSFKVEDNCTLTNQVNTSELDEPSKPIRRRGRPRKVKKSKARSPSEQAVSKQIPDILQSQGGNQESFVEENSTPANQESFVEENSTPANQENTFELSKSIRKSRGRPPKSFYKDLKPTRESTRKRKCPEVICYNRERKMRCMWSDKDKKQLLEGLEEVGPENVKILHKDYLPNKTEGEILRQINMWKEFASLELEKKLMTEKKTNDCAMVNCLTKLDEWINYFAGMEEVSGNKLFALSNVFLLISEYGNFPSPAECNNIDFRAMYRYIHCMLNGIPYYGVNWMTAKVLNDSISDMFAVLREHQQTANLQPHLYNNLLKVKPRCLTYGRPKNRGVGMLKNPDAIMDLPDINPLNIPPHILSKPDIEEYEYDEDDDIVYVDLVS